MFYDAVFSSFNVALLSTVSALIAWFTYSKGKVTSIFKGGWGQLIIEFIDLYWIPVFSNGVAKCRG